MSSTTGISDSQGQKQTVARGRNFKVETITQESYLGRKMKKIGKCLRRKYSINLETKISWKPKE